TLASRAGGGGSGGSGSGGGSASARGRGGVSLERCGWSRGPGRRRGRGEGGVQGSGGGRGLPPLLEVVTGDGGGSAPLAKARRAERRESVVLLRLEDACEHGLGFIWVEVWRRSRPVEHCRAPGV